LEAVKLYPKAIGWSMYFSMGVIMLCMVPPLTYTVQLFHRVTNIPPAFDPQLLGNLYAMPAFQRDFGY
jgi:hypothetical protein